ncbi:hypothetical protein CPB85DRAFT_1434929 [Mucidula mucida]|nr:hypothetical protein CPB85DRAFT_1434929 [Mucidula mucida]
MPRYTLEHFSLSEDFSEQVESHQMLLDDKKYSLDIFEYNCGLVRGESEATVSLTQNVVQARRTLIQRIRANSIVISPPASTILTFGRMVNENRKCDCANRQRYDEIFPHNDSYEYIVVPLLFDRAIFVRHPDTNAITRFDKPYAGLPTVTLTLNPCFLLVQNNGLALLDEARLLPADMRMAQLRIRWTTSPPLHFFYDRCLPQNFPDRRLRWRDDQLLEYERKHFPPSLTSDSSSHLGKCVRSESEDTDLNSEWDPDYKGPFWYPPGVQPWIHSNTSQSARAPWDDDKLGDYVAEPVRSLKDALAQPAAWVDVWNRHRSKRQRSESGCHVGDSDTSDSS